MSSITPTPGTSLRRCAVFGHPVAHSLSPALHLAAYDALGLRDTWRYELYDVQEHQLADLLPQLGEEWVGLSLTIPMKQVVIPMLDHVEPLAEVVGAVNTLIFSGTGASRTKIGANTDVYGLVAAFGEAGVEGSDPRRTAAIVGSGATAASAAAGLAQLGCSTPTVFLRSVARAGELIRAAHRMGLELQLRPFEEAGRRLGEFDMVVSTVPGTGADVLAPDVHDARGVLLDANYERRPTPLQDAWAKAGGRWVGGERMLLHQAVEQVRMMTGVPAPVAAMDAGIQASMAGPRRAADAPSIPWPAPESVAV